MTDQERLDKNAFCNFLMKEGTDLNVDNFSDEQSFFLEHHRTQVLKK